MSLNAKVITATQVSENSGKILKEASTGQSFLVTHRSIPYAYILDLETVLGWLRDGTLDQGLVALLREIDEKIDAKIGDASP